jgi:hypothetical protein
VGKGASDGGSVDVDFGDDAIYASYTRGITKSTKKTIYLMVKKK